MDISKILTVNYSDSEWVLSGEEYDGLEWLSDTPKPTLDELEAQWPDVEKQIATDLVSANRLIAYREQSDPVFFQYQRGEKSEQDWLDAVTAVNELYPYPS